MIALTLHPPWPFAFTHGMKRLENRDWEPDYRLQEGGYLALHSGAPKSFEGEAFDVFQEMHEDGEGGFRCPIPRSDEIVTSAVVAVLRFWGVVRRRPPVHSSQREWWNDSGVGWVFDEVHVLPDPVSCGGKQKLWTLPVDVDEAVRDGWAKAENVWTAQDGWIVPKGG